jgi:protein-S-isoprenylcysteine O-methyltransferase Ste14/pimeloyl-ACP methyl ester carboxylesterase
VEPGAVPRTLAARALLAFVALPGVVAFVVPLLLVWRADAGLPAFHPGGLLLLVPGAALLTWCVAAFYTKGQGTLGPWNPPRRLVVSGPYHRSRNPMYIGVTLVLAGWALGFRSWTLGFYTLAVATAFHLRVVLAEEPRLAETFRTEWPRYAARTPRWIFSTRRSAVAAVLAAIVALPLAGLVYEAWADARGAREFPPPGLLVDVGGRRLHLLCLGEGAPIVIFESSGFGNASSSARARERVATRTRVCSYDRAGKGWSDAGPPVTSFDDLARDLAVLQDRARLHAPFIIVASSIGGLTAEMFARQYPERVAGLVFVDAANSDGIERARPLVGSLTAIACAAGLAAHFGAIRLVDPFGIDSDGSEEARRSAAVTYGARQWGAMCAMARGFRGHPREFDEAPPLHDDIPLIVLSASSEADHVPGFRWLPADLREGRIAAHKSLAARSKKGTWRMVPDSTHLIGSSQPDAVAEAVLELLDAEQRR